MVDRTSVVRDLYRAYETNDRELVERHLAPEYRFWSPQDDGIDRATYFERCWPNAHHLSLFTFDRMVEAGDDVVVTYTAERADGSRFRNTEVQVFGGDQVVRTEVYFGWDLT
jgi:ketosteroid isomerase-like protein